MNPNIALENAIKELTKTLKNNNRPGATRNTKASRVGRGGESNAIGVRSSAEDMSALIDSLKDVHKSASMGSAGINSFLKTIKSVANPLTDTFDKLDKIVNKIAINGSKREAEAAKAMRDYIKVNKGNLDAINEGSKAYAEYVAHVNDMASFQKSKKRDEVAVRAALAKELKLRRELTRKGFTDVASDSLKNYFDFLKNKPGQKLNIGLLDELNRELQSTTKQFDAINQVSTDFIKNIGDVQKKMTDMFEDQVKQFGSSLLTALKKDLSKIPELITNRLQSGFTSNEYIDSMRMGLSPEQLNQLRSNSRDVLSSMTGYQAGANLMDGSGIRERSDELKKVGLIGADASEYLTNALRTSYRTGRTYDQENSQRMLKDSMVIQQAFGGTIKEASARLQDYNTQIYNIRKFGEANSRAEQEQLEKELKTRMLLTKYMGYDIDYMKQQEQLRHNAQFGEIGDRIRGAIMGQVSANMYQDRFGWSDAETELFAKSRRPGAQLTADERVAVLALQEQVGTDKLTYESAASRSGDVGGYIGALTPNMASEYMLNRSGGETMEQITNATITARAERISRGEITQDEYIDSMIAGAQKQAESVSKFDTAVMEFKETISGVVGSPGGAVAGAVAGFGGAMLLTMIKTGLLKRAMSSVMGGSGGRGILSRLGFGRGANGGPPPIPRPPGPPPVPPAGGSRAARLLSKIGGKRGAALIALAGLLGLGVAGSADASNASEPVTPPTPDGDGIGVLGGLGISAGSYLGYKGIAKTVGKVGAKKIPVLGAALGLGFAANRASEGDYLGAYMEGAAGVASTIPVYGTIASLLLEGGIIGRDYAKSNLSAKNGELLDTGLIGALGILTPGMAPLATTYSYNKLIAPSLIDGMNGVKRDPDTGEVIPNSAAPSKQVTLLEKLVALITEQNSMVSDGNEMVKEANTQQTVADHNRKSVAAHIENLSTTMTDMFTVAS